MRQFLGILMVVAALGACTKFPELDAAVSDEDELGSFFEGKKYFFSEEKADDKGA